MNVLPYKPPYSQANFDRRHVFGYKLEHYASERLGFAGFDTMVGKYERIAHWDGDNGEYAHSVDLRLSRSGVTTPGVWSGPIEVKSTPVDVTRWPYSYAALYKTNKGKRDLPVLIVSQRVNADGEHTIVGVCDDGSKRWVQQQPDPARGIEYPVWAVKPEMLITFEEWCEEMRRKLP